MEEDNLILAIFRLIPLKPKYYSYMYRCPICGRTVKMVFEEYKREKCKCGQRLDWNLDS